MRILTLAVLVLLTACGDAGIVGIESPSARADGSVGAVFDKKQPDGTVDLCHFPPGNPDNPQALSVGVKAAAKHVTAHQGDGLIGAAGSYLDEEAGVLYDGSCEMLPPPPAVCPFEFLQPEALEALEESVATGELYWLEATPQTHPGALGTTSQIIVQYKSGSTLRNRLWTRVNPSTNTLPGAYGHPPKTEVGVNFLWGAALPNNGVASSNEILRETSGVPTVVRNTNPGGTATVLSTEYAGDADSYQAAFQACMDNVKSVFDPGPTQ